MKRRKYYLVSLMLMILTLGLQLAAQSQISSRVVAIARGVTLPESAQAANQAVADRYLSRGAALENTALASAVASVLFLLIAAIRREPARYSVLLLFFCLFVVLRLIVV